jgi:hypothetical protein
MKDIAQLSHMEKILIQNQLIILKNTSDLIEKNLQEK